MILTDKVKLMFGLYATKQVFNITRVLQGPACIIKTLRQAAFELQRRVCFWCETGVFSV